MINHLQHASQGYRIYLLDQTGHILGAVEIDADDDAAALRAAQTIDHMGGGKEIWQLARRVAVLDRTGDPAD